MSSENIDKITAERVLLGCKHILTLVELIRDILILTEPHLRNLPPDSNPRFLSYLKTLHFHLAGLSHHTLWCFLPDEHFDEVDDFYTYENSHVFFDEENPN